MVVAISIAVSLILMTYMVTKMVIEIEKLRISKKDVDMEKDIDNLKARLEQLIMRNKL